MLKKFLILAFDDDRYEKSAGRFQAQINPEKYGESLRVDFETALGVNANGVTAKYKGQGPRRLNLEFWFDDTGVLPDNSYEGSSANTVVGRIKSFTDIAYKYDGSIHRSRYLRILWGALLFNCVLERLDIDYTLFSPNGQPLRALLKANFLHFAAADKLTLEARPKSADLTHVRHVGIGDTLPLMCYRIYGDSAFYIQVARVNNLTNFRNLEVNQMIMFPPRDKLPRASASA